MTYTARTFWNAFARTTLVPEGKASVRQGAAGRKALRRSGAQPMVLEQRFMFDGAGAAEIVQALPMDLPDAAEDRGASSDPVLASLGYLAAEGGAVPGEGLAQNLVAVANDAFSAQAQQTLNAALGGVNRVLADLPRRDDFNRILSDAFGNTASDSAAFQARLDALAAPLLEGGLGIEVELRSGSELRGMAGAYAAAGHDGAERIYVNADWIENGASAEQVARVLVEEFGHALDQRLNAALDTAGDEGKVFRALVTEGRVSDADRSRFAQFDDSATLSIEGSSVLVENSVTTNGDIPSIAVDQDSRNTTATSLGLEGLDYSYPEDLYATITEIPSHITLWKQDGVTQVSASDTLTIAELQGLTYKTVADVSGSGWLAWTITEQSGDDAPLVQKQSITVRDIGEGECHEHDEAEYAAPGLAIDNVEYNEGAGTVTFTVTVTGAFDSPFTVEYQTRNGSALAHTDAQGNVLYLDAATNGYYTWDEVSSAYTLVENPGTLVLRDYQAMRGVLTFQPDGAQTRTQTVQVSIYNDVVFEGAEAFYLDLTGSAYHEDEVEDSDGDDGDHHDEYSHSDHGGDHHYQADADGGDHHDGAYEYPPIKVTGVAIIRDDGYGLGGNDDDRNGFPDAQIRVPEVPATITLDETGANGVRSGFGSFADHFVTDASVFGTDGPGSISYALNLGGTDVASGLYALDAADTLTTDGDGFGQGAAILLNQVGGDIVGTVDGVEYIRLSVDATSGVVTFSQTRNVWHSDAADADDAASLTVAGGKLALVQKVTDADGDSDTAAYDLGAYGSFRILDDGPAAMTRMPAVSATIVLDETDAAGTRSGFGSFADHFVTDATVFGSDGAGKITYALNLGGTDVASGLYALDTTDTITGDGDGVGQGSAIVLNQVGSDIVGTVGGVEYIRLSVDATSGVITFTQTRNIAHPDAADGDDLASLTVADGLFTLVQTVTDADGDTSTAALDLGANSALGIRDDGPVAMTRTPEVPMTITLDETDAAGTRSGFGSFADHFVTDATVFGSDGAGKITYALNLGGIDVASGLYALDTTDTITSDGDGVGQGSAVVLNQVGSDIVGTVGGVEYIRLSVEATSGVITFTQTRNIAHPDAADGDDLASLTVADGLLTLVQTVTDADGDTSTAALDLGANSTLGIRDDGPAAMTRTPEVPMTITLDETDAAGTRSGFGGFAGHFVIDATVFGSDGAGKITYALNLGGTDVASGLYAIDTTDTITSDGDGVGQGSAIVLNQVGSDIVGTVGGVEYIRLSVEATSGVITFTQTRNIAHPDAADGDDLASLTVADGLLTLVQTVTDADGDTSTAALDLGANSALGIRDDGPAPVALSLEQGPTLTLDETLLAPDASIRAAAPASSYFVADAAVYGTDGAGAATYVLELAGTNVDSGLYALAFNARQGSSILLSSDGADVVGRVGNDLYLRISVDSNPASATYGELVFTQYRPIWHPVAGVDVSVAPTAGTLALVQTLADADGDEATASFDLGASGVLRIADDAPPAVNDVLVNEGSPFAIFKVSGSGGQSVQLQMSSIGNIPGATSASIGTDTGLTPEYFDGTQWQAYVPGAFVTIPGSGPSLLLVRVSIVNDTANEGSETFTLTATTASGRAATGLGTINDRGLEGAGGWFTAENTTGEYDLLPGPREGYDTEAAAYSLDDDRRLIVGNVDVNEGSPFAVFTVSGAQQLVTLELRDGSALGGPDYGAQLEYLDGNTWTRYEPGTSVPIPRTGTLLVRVAVVNDQPAVAEGPETFELVVTSASTKLESIGTATILDDGTGGIFLAGNRSSTPDDPLAAGYTGPALDDDRAGLTVDNPVVNEGSPTVVFRVSGGQPNASVTLSLASGTAVNGADFGSAFGEGVTLQYNNGVGWLDYNPANGAKLDANGSLLVRAKIVNDALLERSENFRLNISSNSQLASGQATIVDEGNGTVFNDAGEDDPTAVRDDDRALTITVDAPIVNEASPYAYFRVEGIFGQRMTLALASTTAPAGNAVLGGDLSNQLQYFDGEMWRDYAGEEVALPIGQTLLVRVAIVNDAPAVYEGPETFKLVATTVAGVSTEGTCTIIDDGSGVLFNPNGSQDMTSPRDDDRSLQVDSPVVNEGSEWVLFTVQSNAADDVTLALLSGTARTTGGVGEVVQADPVRRLDDNINDYTGALEYSLDAGANWSTYTTGTVRVSDTTPLYVRVRVVNDAQREGAETVRLVVTGATEATGTATIFDDGTGTAWVGNLVTPANIVLDDDFDNDGIAPSVEEILASMVASQTTGNARPGDLNGDGVPDAEQKAVATLAWVDAGSYNSALGGTLETIRPVIFLEALSPDANLRGDDFYALDSIVVIPLTDTQFTDGAGSGGRPTLTGSDAQTQFAWDAIQFGVTYDPAGAGDADLTRTGYQIRIVIDVARSETTRATFNGYLKYVTAETAVNLSALGAVDNAGTAITQAGWYDFLRRGGQGDGAEFIFETQGDGVARATDRLLRIDLYFTDNAFGDNDAAIGRVFDPGMPVFLAPSAPLVVGPDFYQAPLVTYVPPADPAREDDSDRPHQPLRFDSAIRPVDASNAVDDYPFTEPVDSSWPWRVSEQHRAQVEMPFEVARADVPAEPACVTCAPAETAALTAFRSVPDQTIDAGAEVRINLAPDTFVHTRPDSGVVLSATLADGRPLPQWIRFDPQQGVLIVQADAGVRGEVPIRITARDADGREASTLFRVNVRNVVVAPAGERPAGREALSEQLRAATHTAAVQVPSLPASAGLVKLEAEPEPVRVASAREVSGEPVSVTPEVQEASMLSTLGMASVATIAAAFGIQRWMRRSDKRTPLQ